MPAVKQAWPKRALCWSPATPPISSGAPSHSVFISPKCALDGRASGIRLFGMSSRASSSSSHSRLCTLNSMVRDALLTSVTCRSPPVSCQINQLSTVPKASSPRSACARAPGTLSRIHLSLVPEK
ncbi:hypothetical protein D9M68_866170 [compost metagenome]